MEISKRKKITIKVLGYLSLSLISFLIVFFIWKREFQKEEMEKWVTSNSWDSESGFYTGLNHISREKYEIKNLHIKFHTGEICTVVWAYGNTMILYDPQDKKYSFFERFRGSDRWHDIW